MLNSALHILSGCQHTKMRNKGYKGYKDKMRNMIIIWQVC
jgi:hypothetical protein